MHAPTGTTAYSRRPSRCDTGSPTRGPPHAGSGRHDLGDGRPEQRVLGLRAGEGSAFQPAADDRTESGKHREIPVTDQHFALARLRQKCPDDPKMLRSRKTVRSGEQLDFS
ncbi:hypothetical protein [Streptomyces sp. NPDC055681]